MLVIMPNKKNRLHVIQTVIEIRLRRNDAASQLNLTESQSQRLMNSTENIVNLILSSHDVVNPICIVAEIIRSSKLTLLH